MAAVGRGVDDGVADASRGGGTLRDHLGDEEEAASRPVGGEIGPRGPVDAAICAPHREHRRSPSFSFHTPSYTSDLSSAMSPHPRLAAVKTVLQGSALTKEELVSPCRMTSVAG